MSIETIKPLVQKEIKPMFMEQLKSNSDILLINLSTKDGFLLIQEMAKGKAPGKTDHDVEGDKLAAISSSLGALAESASMNILESSMGTINIESETGTILCINLELSDLKCVLTLASKKNMSLAQARFIAKRLKDDIVSLP